MTSEAKEIAKARVKLKGSSQDALLLLRDAHPAPFDAPGDTYMGGLPKLPSHVSWPTTSGGKALSFIAQIGLANVPAFASRHLLPKSGVLFFFGEMWTDHRERREPEAKVIYCDTSVADLPPREKPPIMPPMCPDDVGYPRGWLAADDFWRQVDFRYPLSARRFKSYYSGPSDEEFDDAFHRAAEELEREAFLAALGEPRLVQMEGHWSYRSEECPTWLDWPKSALHARSVMRALDVICAQRPDYQSAKDILGGIAEATAGMDDLTPLSVDAQRTIHAIMERFGAECEPLMRPYWIGEIAWNAISFASQFAIVRGRPELVPNAFSDCARDRAGWRALQGRPNALGAVYVAHDTPRHQMFGHSRNRQNEVDEHRDKVLLFQLDGEQDLALYPQQSGSYYFFARKSDLQRRNFDAVHFSGSM